MNNYKDYMNCYPMTDGEEMRCFFDEINEEEEMEMTYPKMEQVRSYLLAIIQKDDELKTKTLHDVKEIALKEVYYGAERYWRFSKRNAIRHWLTGLRLAVAFTYEGIAERMRLWGYKMDKANQYDYEEKQELYWKLLTDAIYNA